MVNRLKDHHPEEIKKKEDIEELVEGFIVIVRGIVNNAGSEKQAIERAWNVSVGFVREYEQIINWY